ncbi:MAG: hypothetical protein NT023_18020, partial [Armatimonadetes bacterium]|nr:hypothetical protein [Armatimonadota bacterium]
MLREVKPATINLYEKESSKDSHNPELLPQLASFTLENCCVCLDENLTILYNKHYVLPQTRD